MDTNKFIDIFNNEQGKDPYIPESYWGDWETSLNKKVESNNQYHNLKYSFIGSAVGSVFGVLAGATCALITNQIMWHATQTEMLKQHNALKITETTNINNLINNNKNDIEALKHKNGGQQGHILVSQGDFGGGGHKASRATHNYLKDLKINIGHENLNTINGMMNVDNKSLNSYNVNSSISTFLLPTSGFIIGGLSGCGIGYGVSKYINGNIKIKNNNCVKHSQILDSYSKLLNSNDYRPNEGEYIYDRITYEFKNNIKDEFINCICIIQGYFDTNNFKINKNKKVEITIMDEHRKILFSN